VQEASRRTRSRRELARHEHFDDVSPEVGVLDEEALDRALADDPDAALALLADLTGATDPKLKELARRSAGRIVVDLARRGSVTRRGVGRIVRQRYRPGEGTGDLDLEVAPETLALARRVAPDPDELRVRGWVRPGTALALVVDRSGSMGGAPLAAAAVGAAAVAWRAPADHSVLAFAGDVVVVKPQDVPMPAERVVNDVLALRGFGTTDLALALRAAGEQLQRSQAGRKVTVLLSDCRTTAGADAGTAAASLDELWIVAPEGDSADAEALAARVGARLTTVAGPADIPAALARLLDQ